MNKESRYMSVQWKDSTLCPASAVYTIEEALDIELITLDTVGHLVFENEDVVCLALSRHGEEDWRGLTLIPKVNIITMTELHLPTEKA